ncbi:MAG: hypothetical protein O7A03_01230 [Alphaproteobacteria bacterium]|nr:hypothetical protein [Alphaproteobacteria bacterium]
MTRTQIAHVADINSVRICRTHANAPPAARLAYRQKANRQQHNDTALRTGNRKQTCHRIMRRQYSSHKLVTPTLTQSNRNFSTTLKNDFVQTILEG